MRTIGQHSDPQLWADAVEGCQDAFGVLYDRHVQAVYRHCFRLTASLAAAEDATQSTFLLAWRKRAGARLVDDSMLPWLLSMAANVVRDQRRSVLRWRRAVLRMPPERDSPDIGEGVADRVDSQRRMWEVLRVVRRLPPAEREALALCVWSEVSYANAAEVLGINEAAVRARVSRAKRRLARLLDSESGHQEDPR